MKVLMRRIWSDGTEYGAGCETFERERAAVLLAGYRIVPPEELDAGERAQAGSSSLSGTRQVIETLAEGHYVYAEHRESQMVIVLDAGRRYSIDVAIERDRGEE